MKLSDFVASFLEENSVDKCFMVSGGAVLHILDSIERKTKIQIVCSQHEQFAATEADAFSRVSESKLGLCVATSGPGATNLVTGVSNAFFDSIPLICVTGQVSTFRKKEDAKLRQYGFQETNVVDIFRPITKYVVELKKPEDIKYELGKAIHYAKTARPGPVLIDIPDDLQRCEVDPDSLRSYPKQNKSKSDSEAVEQFSGELNSFFSKSKKPLIILGAGVRISGSAPLIRSFIEELNVPFVTTWGAKDLFNEDHHLNVGTFGVCGPRPGNWAISECDLLLVLGARLNQMQIGGKVQEFAPNACKVIVDIDNLELEKFNKLGLEVDLSINIDLKSLIKSGYLNKVNTEVWNSWLRSLKSRFSIISEHASDVNQVNAYQFVDFLSEQLQDNSIVFTDAGGNLCWTMQAFKIKNHQRLISAWNHSPMGFSLPAAIGAVFSAANHKVTCIIGDGGLMMCLQELGTVARHNLPIDIFIFNNRGHGIQKQTINTWLGGNQIGVDYDTGLFFPNFEFIAKSFGLAYHKVESISQARELLPTKGQKPTIYDVMIKPTQTISPMLIYGGSLTNLDDSVVKPNFPSI